jgi:squalene-hopene/tetraprenyl-beta-curcumene cyclase
MNDLSLARTTGNDSPDSPETPAIVAGAGADGAAIATAGAVTQATAALDDAVTRATDAILAAQKPDGHWVYELEADATIPAEYVLLVHYLGEEPNPELEQKIARYLRERESVLRAEDDRRAGRRRPHAPRP